MNIDPTAFLFIVFGAFAAGVLTAWLIWRYRLGAIHTLADELLDKAQQDIETIQQKARLQQEALVLQQKKDFSLHCEARERELREERTDLKQRAESLEDRIQRLDAKSRQVDQKEQILLKREKACQEVKVETEQEKQRLTQSIEQLAGMTRHEATNLLLLQVKQHTQSEAQQLRKRLLAEAEQQAATKTKNILVTAINRLAVSTVSEATVTTVALPSDEMKGRIIGREGRNIRAFERETGVNILIDDTPGAVVLSSFDPLRKQIAKMALMELVLDGRIHPSRIQAIVASKKEEIHELILQHGEDAAARLALPGLHPELLRLLGQLKFRYSYGQNALDHSIEVAQIMGLIANELGLDAQLAKRIGLLHDIGKAAPQDMKVSHALAGHRLAQTFGENSDVANGIGCHHNEMEPTTIEGSLCSAADAISASRPGARNEAVEAYVSRLQALETLTEEFPGVEKAYSLQAGREVFISVLPDMIDDNGLENLARDIRAKIEESLTYPGKIKVQVVREKRVTEYAR